MTIEADPTAPFSRFPLYICHSGEEDDRDLAAGIAREANDFAEPHCLTVYELQRRFPGKIIPGMTLAILSPAIANDPALGSALAGLLAHQYRQTFLPHYCICRGATP